MNVGQLIELLENLPKDMPIIDNNPEASDEGLGHWYIPRYLHLNDYDIVELKDCRCLRFKYGEEDEGWQDDCWNAVSNGRFFKIRNLNEENFVWSGEEKPTKDGNYLCVCRHGSRYTLETHSFFAKIMADGREREEGQWGFGCEHIPEQYGRSYPVTLWDRTSYKPFSDKEA